MHAIHNSWRNFEEPDRFLPERWLAPGADYARLLQGGELACTSGEHEMVLHRQRLTKLLVPYGRVSWLLQDGELAWTSGEHICDILQTDGLYRAHKGHEALGCLS